MCDLCWNLTVPLHFLKLFAKACIHICNDVFLYEKINRTAKQEALGRVCFVTNAWVSSENSKKLWTLLLSGLPSFHSNN